MTGALRRPPSPPGGVLLGNLRDWLRAPYTSSRSWARELGDVVEIRFPGGRALMLFHPDQLEELLITGRDAFQKAPLTRGLECITGKSMVTLSGSASRRRRKLAHPALAPEQLRRYTRTAAHWADRYARRWVRTGRVDAYPEMLDFTFDVLADSLTSAPLGADRAVLRECFEAFWADFSSDEFMLLSTVTDGDPYGRIRTPRRRRQQKRLEVFDAIIRRLLRFARDNPDDPGIIAALNRSCEVDGGLSDAELRDDVATLILAAQETTGVGLALALDALGRDPALHERIAEEVTSVLGDRAPTFEDRNALPYTSGFVREVLRLHPPIWGVSRQAVESTTIGGYPVEPGTQVIAAAGVVHRDPRWWGADADAMRPERWIEDSDRPRLSWIPFGAGPHLCIGMQLAMVEMTVAVAIWSRLVRIRCEAEAPEFTLRITNLPKHDIPLTVRGAP